MSDPTDNTPAESVTASDLIGGESIAPAGPAPAESPAPPSTLPADAPPPAPPPPNPFPGVKDSLGREFDPLKFRVKDGRPQLDTKGRFCPANSGRKSPDAPAGSPAKSPAASPSTAAPAADRPAVARSTLPPDNPTPPGPDRFDLAAEVYCRGFYAGADAIFSGKGEWMPDDDSEHVNLRTALATYLRHKGAEELPPGYALAFAVATYGAKRVQRPNTNTRIRDIVSHWKNKFAAWRAGRKLAALPAVELAPEPPKAPAPGAEAAAAYLAAHAKA